MKKIILFLLIGLVSSCKAQPEKLTSNDKKAIKYFEKAMVCFQTYSPQTGMPDYPCVEENLLNALERDPNYTGAYVFLSAAYQEQGKYQEAAESLKKVLAIDPGYSSSVYFSLGELQLKFGDYDNALVNLQSFVHNPNASPQLLPEAKTGIENCKFAIAAIKNPVPFNPINMGTAINSPNPEYFPSFTADDNTLLYTRLVIDNNSPMGMQEDFYISYKKDGKWQSSEKMSSTINTIYNEGAPTLSADGQYLIFTACAGPDGTYGGSRTGYGSCDLFYSHRVGNQWTKPKNMGKNINTSHWESQPCFSADGRSLYFVRGLKGVGQQKNSDIFVSTLTDQGYWSKPQRLPNNINTKGQEASVMIHPDGQTLYFSSNGHVGMGGLDIYMSRLNADDTWGAPVNLGYPINTFKDENSLLVATDGEIALFASNREGGEGQLDLYSFELPQQFRPQRVTYMKGHVFDINTKMVLEAHFELIDVETGRTIVESYSNSADGEFLVSLPANHNYALNVSRDKYQFYSKNFKMMDKGSIDSIFLMDIPLTPIKIGGKVLLDNIFFDVDKFDLKPESKVELDKLYNFLITNPTIKIEIGGHTDSDGDKAHNLTLSSDRAKSVVNYLKDKGIEAGRLSFKGYGDTQPKVPNTSSDNKAINRRTEFTIIEK